VGCCFPAMRYRHCLVCHSPCPIRTGPRWLCSSCFVLCSLPYSSEDTDMGPVAGQAKQGQPNRKIMKRLTRRINAYERTNATSKAPAGSFHRPGSMQKG
jgi:hypothetical protein